MTDLPPEPPVGSIAAVPGCTPFIRFSNGWGRDGHFGFRTWLDIWTSDLRVLRNGWEGRATSAPVSKTGPGTGRESVDGSVKP